MIEWNESELKEMWSDQDLRICDIAEKLGVSRPWVGKKGAELFGPRGRPVSAATRAGLTGEKLKELILSGKTNAEIGKMYGVTRNVITGERKKHGLMRKHIPKKKNPISKGQLKTVRTRFGGIEKRRVPKPISPGNGFRIVGEGGDLFHMSGEKTTKMIDAAWRGTDRQAHNMLEACQIDGLRIVGEALINKHNTGEGV